MMLIAFVALWSSGCGSRKAAKLPVNKLDPWILQTNDPRELARASGTSEVKPEEIGDQLDGTYLGNGYIGARIGPEGVGSFNGTPLPCLMSGLWDGEATKPLPNWSDFPLFDQDGKRFTLDLNAPYRQTLNMREGYVETELTLKSGGQRLVGKVTFFISLVRVPTLRSLFQDAVTWRGHSLHDVLLMSECQGAAIRYELVPDNAGVVAVKTVIDSSGWKALYAPVNPFVSMTRNQFVAIGQYILDGRNQKLKTNLHNVSVAVESGKQFVLTKFVSISSPRKLNVPNYSSNDVSEDVQNGLNQLCKKGFNAAFAEHKRAWSERWKSDIVIDGDPAAQQAVHAMMFYLMCSASPQYSISPVGLSAEGPWHGHIFWDADTWMFPALILEYPELAAGISSYRYDTLYGAESNAAKRKLKGAEYAWESAATGVETAPSPYNEERHITGDVALTASACAAIAPIREGDTSRLHELLMNTSRYWVSRVTYNKASDRYEILNVIPPDENANGNRPVNNSVYTNAVAKMNLQQFLKSFPSGDSKTADIIKKMYIPFDEKNRRFLAYDGYKGGKTKQADTELLIYPLCYPMPEDVKRNTFDFYKTKTDPNGPAMTSSIHAIIAAELNRPDEAYKHFQDSYQPFMRGPMLMFNEKRSQTYENACFLTGCAGSVQSVLYGFAGLRALRSPQGFKEMLPGLYIKPCLPPKWKSLKVTGIKWKGKSYDLTIDQENQWKVTGEGTGNR